jgi:hypothetical protein
MARVASIGVLPRAGAAASPDARSAALNWTVGQQADVFHVNTNTVN